MLSTLYSRQIFMKFEFSVHPFEKYSNIKFHENPSNRDRVTASKQTEGHDITADPRNSANAPTMHFENAVREFVVY